MTLDGARVVIDPEAPPGTIYLIDPRRGYWPPSPFDAFDVLIHSTPARTKGHAFEIGVHEEVWALVEQYKADINRQLFG